MREGEDEAGHRLAGELTPRGHRLVQRVYYEDTDFSGVVYHARYLHFLERGRTDLLRLLGISQSALSDGEARLAFVVRRMTIEFRASARMDDVLVIETVPAAAGGARLRLDQTITAGGRLLIEAQVDVAIIDGKGRPRRMPAGIAERFAKLR